ncbi:BPI fold-containing family C protein [Alca torda]
MLKMWYSFLLCLLSLQLEANPGLKVRITQKGLDYGRRIGMELLKQAVLKETFPSWSGQETLSVVKVNYVISRLRINDVAFPETAASFIPGTGISLSVAHASATISADWRMSAWLLKDQGGITVSISGLFIAVIFKVSRDSTGRLSVLLHNCQLSINSVKVKLNGGSSWIYSFLSGYIEEPIHTKLDKYLCLNIKYKIQMMDAQLRKHKVLSQIDAFAQIDYSLVSSPAVFKSHINLDLKGTVYPVGNHTDPPFVPAPFALPDQGDSMLYVGVSSYFLKSASLAYYRAGAFNITISKELATTFNLNTVLCKDFVPEIALSYVAACPVLLKLMATSPPAVSLNADRCILQISGSVEVFAVLPNSTTHYLFTGNLTASTRANLTITKQKLIISLLLKRLQFSLLHSTLGSSEMSPVNFLSYALRSAVIPVINDKLGKGLPLLNLAHTTLTGPVIKIKKGHLVISTDVHYKHEEGGDEDLDSHVLQPPWWQLLDLIQDVNILLVLGSPSGHSTPNVDTTSLRVNSWTLLITADSGSPANFPPSVSSPYVTSLVLRLRETLSRALLKSRSCKKARKMAKICCSLLLLSLLSGQLNANPGLKVRITQKGLEYAKEVGLEILKQNMEKERFPDLSGYEKYGLGNVKYNISRIHVTAVEFPSASISLIPGTGIKLVIGNASLTIDMNWNIRTWMFKDTGRSTVYISKVFVTAIFSTPLDNTGHTSISLTSCRTTSGDIDIKLNGKSGFLHNFFIKYLKKPIHRTLVTNSCPNIRAGIHLLDEDLRSLNVLMPIDDLAEADYSLNSLPAVFRQFIDLDLKGIVYPAGNYTGPPYVAAPFTIPDQSDSMLYLAFSEYFFQTSSFAYYTAGAFNITITEETCSYFNISTEIFGSIIPEVAKYSVTPYPVMLKLMATEIPIISLEQDSFTVEIQGSMEVFAVLPDSTTQSLFTMNIAANTSLALNIFDQKLVGSLCLNRLQFSLAHSNVGYFEISLLENILSYILQTEVIPSANAKLSKGFPLPNLANVTFTRPHITLVQGYMLISTDVHYKH